MGLPDSENNIKKGIKPNIILFFSAAAEWQTIAACGKYENLNINILYTKIICSSQNK